MGMESDRDAMTALNINTRALNRRVTENNVDKTIGPFIEAPGKSRQAMNWFFADKNRLFWVLQIAGWTGFGLLHVLSVSSYIAGWSVSSVAYSIASSTIGFLTTSLLLRSIFRFARRQPPATLLVLAIAATIAAAILMAAVKAMSFGFLFGDEWRLMRGAKLGTDNLLLLIRPDISANVFLLMSWGGFYFGINYYLTLRNETERALLSARLADQAQLKMLRYQLNPHFLFNTLNAISTLVLEKDTPNANEMLTKLSAFLRYSLDSDPLQKTSLAEEVRALQLYLDIESTRFGSRLKITTDISEEALDARVPSLILQPAIENAIKYAVAKMEDGGEIIINARHTDDMLVMKVCDNGPFAPANPEDILRNSKTGVGLLNMRDRLFHMYGSNQSFCLSRLEPTGLCVTLKVPFETKTSVRPI